MARSGSGTTHPDECEMGYGEDSGPGLEVGGDRDREVLVRIASGRCDRRVLAGIEDVAHHPGGVYAVARSGGCAVDAREEADGDGDVAGTGEAVLRSRDDGKQCYTVWADREI